jgi:hypothetical protein
MCSLLDSRLEQDGVVVMLIEPHLGILNRPLLFVKANRLQLAHAFLDSVDGINAVTECIVLTSKGIVLLWIGPSEQRARLDMGVLPSEFISSIAFFSPILASHHRPKPRT